MVWMLGLLVVGSLLVCRRGPIGVVKVLGFGMLAVVMVTALMYWPR